MKKNYKCLLFLVITCLGISELQSQDIMDVPPGEASDALFFAISGDTLENGERANLNRIYRLERGQNYLMAATINANYPIRLIAGGDESLRPPMIIGGQFTDGTNISPLFNLNGENDRHSFENIFFNGVDLNRDYLGFTQAVVAKGDGQSITYQGCIFNAFTGGATKFDAADQKVYIRDCNYRNGVSATHMFIGQQATFPAAQVDTMIITNNTFFNNNSFLIFHENGFARFQVIEHNTIFTNLVDPTRLRFASNASIRSNLYYGTLAYGDSEEFRTLTAYEPDGTPTSIISIYNVPSDLLSAEDMVESDRKISVTHNNYFTPSPIKEYWESNSEIDDDIAWMNVRTQALFDDESGHPGLDERKNLNLDPIFTDAVTDDYIVTAVKDFCETYRATLTPGEPLSGDAGSLRNYDAEGGVDILTDIVWPLPEHLAYTEIALLTGGHDGLPIGDLNWHGGLRDDYLEPSEIGLSSVQEITKARFEISPNPVKSDMTITSPDLMGNLEIYNIDGKMLISENVNGFSATINVRGLEKGVYILKVNTKDTVSAKQFIVI